MRFIRTAKVSTDPFSQLVSRKQAISLDHVALSVDPFGLNRVKPGALCRQEEGQDPHAFARLLDLLVMLANPGANSLTLVPGGIIPDQKPIVLALGSQALTTPVQKLGGDGAHRSARDKAQPHLIPLRVLRRAF